MTSPVGVAASVFIISIDLPVLAFVSFFSGLGCAAAPASSMYLVLDPELKSQQKNA